MRLDQENCLRIPSRNSDESIDFIRSLMGTNREREGEGFHEHMSCAMKDAEFAATS